MTVGLHDLYSQIRMLHQDISINNLAFYYDDDVFVVVLLDFDLASTPESTWHVRKHRTGTVPFMARQILDTRYLYFHKIYHDLESLFYCLVWHALGYRRRQSPPGDPLRLWRKGLPPEIFKAKIKSIEDGETWKEICSELDAEKWPRVKAIWIKYNQALKNRPKRKLSVAEIERVAKQAQEKALESGKSTREAGKVYAEVCSRMVDENDTDSTLLAGLGITYKEWMLGAGEPIPTDLNCTCC